MTNREHLKQLCRTHNVRQITEKKVKKTYGVVMGEHDRAIAFPIDRKICSMESPGSDVGYFGLLHEIGHIVLNHRHSQSFFDRIVLGPDDNEIRMEEEAWEWAFANAWKFPSSRIIEEMMNSLLTYCW